MTAKTKDDIQTFNRRAATYEKSRRQNLIFDRVQKIVLTLTCRDKPETVLDVGCGTGRLLRKVKEQWSDANLIGVDPAESMIAEAKQLLPNAQFHVGMAESLPLHDASVDLVLSTMSFHHWADQAKGISEIARVLRTNGRFVLADIIAPFGLSMFFKHFKRSNASKTRALFAESGLNVELQQRQWPLFSVLVVTIGRKHLYVD